MDTPAIRTENLTRTYRKGRKRWFRKPPLYGFRFADPRPLPFRRYSGRLYFFEVTAPGEAPAGRTPQLLVSVRDLGEAAAALAGGADLIDVKEPIRGPLGRADEATIRGIVDAGC